LPFSGEEGRRHRCKERGSDRPTWLIESIDRFDQSIDRLTHSLDPGIAAPPRWWWSQQQRPPPAASSATQQAAATAAGQEVGARRPPPLTTRRPTPNVVWAGRTCPPPRRQPPQVSSRLHPCVCLFIVRPDGSCLSWTNAPGHSQHWLALDASGAAVVGRDPCYERPPSLNPSAPTPPLDAHAHAQILTTQQQQRHHHHVTGM
jgi:hypothetical protein